MNYMSVECTVLSMVAYEAALLFSFPTTFIETVGYGLFLNIFCWQGTLLSNFVIRSDQKTHKLVLFMALCSTTLVFLCSCVCHSFFCSLTA